MKGPLRGDCGERKWEGTEADERGNAAGVAVSVGPRMDARRFNEISIATQQYGDFWEIEMDDDY